MLVDKQDSLGLNFADPSYKEVHAGHLFAAKVRLTVPKNAEVDDVKVYSLDARAKSTRE